MLRLARELAASPGDIAREQDLRNFLGTFNFTGDMVQQPVGTMSGGEKARLVLAMIVWQRPNLLLLDEPTNHLDLATREALSVALNEFEGTVMLVSHDRALLRAVCDEFWLVARGAVAPFDGDLDEYQAFLLEEARRAREAARPPAPPSPTQQPRKAQAQQRQELAARRRPLQRELDAAERAIAALEAEKTQIEARLATPVPPSELADAGRRLKVIQEELSTLEERWLALGEELERLA
jgi:ATP-binding cassette subfamily F protein 3